MVILPLLAACTSLDYQVIGGSTPKSPSHQIQAQETPADISIETTWSQLGLLMSISGSRSGFHTLGIVEYGTGASYDPWTGEDCLNGYNLDEETVLWCHKISEEETFFWHVEDPFDLDPDSETYNNYLLQRTYTYILWENTTADCWVWGNYPEYYSTENCQVLPGER